MQTGTVTERQRDRERGRDRARERDRERLCPNTKVRKPESRSLGNTSHWQAVISIPKLSFLASWEHSPPPPPPPPTSETGHPIVQKPEQLLTLFPGAPCCTYIVLNSNSLFPCIKHPEYRQRKH